MTKNKSCGCRPGTYEDGWQEVRSTECDQAERDAFALAIQVAASYPRQDRA